MIYRHKKRGTKYRIIHEALLQSSHKELDNVSVVVYQDIRDESKIWVRSKGEFFDGRFEEVDTGEAPRSTQPKVNVREWMREKND